MPELENVEKVIEQMPPPCAHDPRPFLPCMAIGVAPDGVAPDGDMRKLLATLRCAYYSIPGSKYCRPHTVLNNAVTPALKNQINDWMAQTIHSMAQGYTVLFHNALFREKSYPYRNCTARGTRQD